MSLNSCFLEEYKRLDNLCKDYLQSQRGVSDYIEQMEKTEYSDRCYLLSWDEDYKQLKHLRWVRNKLAHEVGTLDCDFCNQDDIDWIRNFRNQILNGSDPFTIIRKSKQNARKTSKQYTSKPLSPAPPTKEELQESIWDKIIYFLDKLFN